MRSTLPCQRHLSLFGSGGRVFIATCPVAVLAPPIRRRPPPRPRRGLHWRAKLRGIHPSIPSPPDRFCTRVVPRTSHDAAAAREGRFPRAVGTHPQSTSRARRWQARRGQRLGTLSHSPMPPPPSTSVTNLGGRAAARRILLQPATISASDAAQARPPALLLLGSMPPPFAPRAQRRPTSAPCQGCSP